jgi:small subunit ribosomal protein S6
MAVSYDLFVLLDPEAPEDRRSAVIEQVRSQIGSGGELKGDADWGMRRLSYEIDHRREAQYHLFQFVGTPEVLTQLDRSLAIDDSVLRHRIIRLTGEAPETTPRPAEEPRRTADDRPGRDGAPEQRDEPEATPEGVEATPAAAAPAQAEAAPEEQAAAPEELAAAEEGTAEEGTAAGANQGPGENA